MDPHRPSFMITGTGVPGKIAARVAYGGFWLSVGSEAIRIPGGGIGPLSRSFTKVADEIRRQIDRSGRPGLVAGHSQGGFDALKFGLEYPEYVHSVMTISTPHNGLEYSIAEMRRELRRRIQDSRVRPLARLVNPTWHGLEPTVRRLLQAGVPSLHSLAYIGEEVLELRARVAAEWRKSVRLALVGSIDDKLVRVGEDEEISSPFDLNLPDGHPDLYCLFTGEEPNLRQEEVMKVKAERAGHLSMVADPVLYRLAMRYSYPPETAIEPVQPLKLVV